jgi:spermidine/putrescine transport system permease protein
MVVRGLFARLILFAVGAWLLVFGLVPYLMLLVASLLERSPDTLVRPALSLASYRRLLESALLSMTMESIALALVATLLCLLIGYPFSFLLARARQRWQGLLLLLVMIPFWTNSLIRTYALVAVLKGDGLINRALLALGLIDAPLQLMYTPLAVFIGLVYTLLPFMILPLFAAFKGLDHRLIEAGRDLGAGRVQVLVRVIVPLTLPGVIAGCMLVFLPALGMFYIPDVLGGARTMLLGNYIRDQFLQARDLPMGAAASITMTLIMGGMLLLYHRARQRQDQESLEQ